MSYHLTGFKNLHPSVYEVEGRMGVSGEGEGRGGKAMRGGECLLRLTD